MVSWLRSVWKSGFSWLDGYVVKWLSWLWLIGFIVEWLVVEWFLMVEWYYGGEVWGLNGLLVDWF